MINNKVDNECDDTDAKTPANETINTLKPVNNAEINKYFAGTPNKINLYQNAFNLRNEAIELQQHFHKYPELSFKEYKTSQYIINYLNKLNDLKIETNIGETGIVATLNGKYDDDGKCILFRADMDALPITEDTDYEYKSVHDGVSHSCGHDYHISILLITAKILCSLKDQIRGKIKFLFQPAEEIGGGAIKMIKDKKSNFMDDVDYVYGLHVWCDVPLGTVLINDKILMSGCSNFEINIFGVGCHGASPQNGKDAIIAGTTLVQQIQTIISRNLNPSQMGVITIGSFHAGTKANVISNKAKLQGTMRWFTDESEKLLKRRLSEICKGVEVLHGVTVKLEYDEYHYPSTKNHQIGYKTVCNAAKKIVGIKGLNDNVPSSSASEDFSYFLNEKPGAFFFIGGLLENDKNEKYFHHQAKFKVDNRCLVIGCSMFLQIVNDVLMNNKLQK